MDLSRESFRYNVITPEDLDDVTPLAIDEFVLGEPFCKGLQVQPEDFRSMLTKGIKTWLGDRVSVGAWNIQSELVGVLIATLLTSDDDLQMWSALKPINEKTFAYVEFEKIMESSFNIFQEEPNVKFVLEQNLLCVHPEYRGKGIGYGLVEKAECLGLEKGCTAAIVEASGLSSQKIFSNLGYGIRFEYLYADFELNGKKVFDLSLMDGTVKNTIMVKHLL